MLEVSIIFIMTLITVVVLIAEFRIMNELVYHTGTDRKEVTRLMKKVNMNSRTLKNQLMIWEKNTGRTKKEIVTILLNTVIVLKRMEPSEIEVLLCDNRHSSHVRNNQFISSFLRENNAV